MSVVFFEFLEAVITRGWEKTWEEQEEPKIAELVLKKKEEKKEKTEDKEKEKEDTSPPPPPPPSPPPLPPSSSVSSSPGPKFKRVTKGGLKAGCVRRQIMLELREANKHNFSDGQVTVEFDEQGEEENMFVVKVGLFPNDGIYQDGEFYVEMTLTESYPIEKPTFKFLTPIFHPNVDDEDGDICFNLIEEEDEFDEEDDYIDEDDDDYEQQIADKKAREEIAAAKGEIRIADYAHGLLFLLYYPNLFDPLNCTVPTDEKEFKELVRQSIEGGEVLGKTYERSKRLPELKKEDDKEEKEGEQGEKEKGEDKGKEEEKKWVWKLKGEDWVQEWE